MKKVLITGASGGLGEKLSEYFLSNGYFCYLHFCDGGENVAKIHEIYPDTSMLIHADFRDEEEVIEMCNHIDDIDIIINNAGVDHISEMDDKNYQSFIDVYKINTLAPFTIMKHLGPKIDKRRGVIVNISSDNTIYPSDSSIEYDISKSGLNVLTKVFSDYLQETRVNAILFGWLDTPMNDLTEEEKAMLNFVPLDEAVEEVVKLVKTDKTSQLKIVNNLE